MENLKSIKKFLIFKDIEDKDTIALLRCLSARIVSYKKSEIIINRGERINYLYIVINGCARDIITEVNGNITTIIDYKEGDIIGLETLFANRKTFQTDIVAREDSSILLVDVFRCINPCNNYCPRHVRLMNNIISLLAKQNNKLANRVKELTKSSTKDKVLCYLNNIKTTIKKDEFNIPFDRQELANYLGVERSALSKELSSLQKEGKIEFHKNHFKILK